MWETKDLSIFLVLAAIGVMVWLGISVMTNQREAWDSYFMTVGLPLMALGSSIAGYVQPKHPWLWGFAPVLLQPFALFWGQNPMEGQFGPLGLIVFAIFGVVLTFCAMV